MKGFEESQNTVWADKHQLKVSSFIETLSKIPQVNDKFGLMRKYYIELNRVL